MLNKEHEQGNFVEVRIKKTVIGKPAGFYTSFVMLLSIAHWLETPPKDAARHTRSVVGWRSLDA
jgi:hypothetical protein